MPVIKVNEAGSVGVSTDLEPYSLPPNVWTGAGNVRFIDRYAEKFTGSAEAYATPLNAPYYLYPMRKDGSVYWVYAGLTAVGAVAGGTHADITRAVGGAYGGIASDLWTGTELGGILVLNNSVDVPQYWPNVSLATDLADLTAWPAGYQCKSIVAYKQHLFALNMTQGGTDYPHRILWSDIADPGAVPASWDITDATRDAGETELSDTGSGGIVNGAVLGDSLIIYKENSVFEVTPSNDAFIFNFDKLFDSFGLASMRGVHSIPRRKEHLVYTGDDLVIHNGIEVKSILSERERRRLLNDVDSINYANAFIVSNLRHQELWFCYPTQGQTQPNKALAFNYETEVISYRDLPSIPHIASGSVNDDVAVVVWDSVVGSWDAQIGVWGAGDPSLKENSILMADAANTKLYSGDTTNTEDGAVLPAYLERQGLAVSGYDQRGNPVQDLINRKVIDRVWPKMEGGPVDIKISVQEDIDGPVTYSPAMSFDPSTERYLDLPYPLSGLLYGIRVESAADVAWKMHGYNINLTVDGETE